MRVKIYDYFLRLLTDWRDGTRPSRVVYDTAGPLYVAKPFGRRWGTLKPEACT